ncbi:hypothetical protein MRX96_048148 [Rhipicephalus microplus]
MAEGPPKTCHYPSSCNCSKQEVQEGDRSSMESWYFNKSTKTCNVSEKNLGGCNKFDTKDGCNWYCLGILP